MKIFPLAWEVIEAIEMYDIPVVSLTSDGAKSNRNFYSLHCRGKKSSNIPHKTFNPFRKGFNLYFFCDTLHLLKTARNCFSNSFAHSKKRKMQVCISYIMPTRGVSRIHEAITINPEGIARGINGFC